jgi:hypothetical protein
MHDEFTKRERMDSLSLLNDSIGQLKDAHSTLVLTTQAFKQSIAKEKQIFERLVAVEPKPVASDAALTPDTDQDKTHEHSSVLSADNPLSEPTTVETAPADKPITAALPSVEPSSEPDDASELNIAGTLATEVTKPIMSH